MLDKNQEIIYGIHPILELLKAKRRKLYSIYTTKPQPKAWSLLEKTLPNYTKIHYVKKDDLNKIAGSTDHQGIVGIASSIVIRKKFFDPNKDKFLLMLDEIQDPRNLGAILRSAYCTNVNGVIITQKSSSYITAAAIKASAGLSEHLEIYISTDARKAVNELKEANYNIYLSTLTDKANAITTDFKLPLCIVIGNEAQGISKNILNSGHQITLPQKETDISYNASVAAGIILFLVSTQNKLI